MRHSWVRRRSLRSFTCRCRERPRGQDDSRADQCQPHEDRQVGVALEESEFGKAVSGTQPNPASTLLPFSRPS